MLKGIFERIATTVFIRISVIAFALSLDSPELFTSALGGKFEIDIATGEALFNKTNILVKASPLSASIMAGFFIVSMTAYFIGKRRCSIKLAKQEKIHTEKLASMNGGIVNNYHININERGDSK